MKHKFLPKFNDELLNLIPEWEFIQKRGHVSVEWHSYNVLYLVWNDPTLKEMSEEDQNILKWSALLHDM